MIDTLKTFSMMVLVGACVRLTASWIDSPYLMKFLEANLINLQIALLAITTTTAGVVLSRMREMMDNLGVDFSLTIDAFKKSAYEQIFLIISSIVLLSAISSKVVIALHPNAQITLECLLASVFFASLYNLYDNAKSIFIIISFRR